MQEQFSMSDNELLSKSHHTTDILESVKHVKQSTN